MIYFFKNFFSKDEGEVRSSDYNAKWHEVLFYMLFKTIRDIYLVKNNSICFFGLDWAPTGHPGLLGFLGYPDA